MYQTMKCLILILVQCFVIYVSHGLRSVYPKHRSLPTCDDMGVPLILTPYIEAGKIEEGQAAAQVHLPGTNVTSYAGFLTVNKDFNSNLYIWFFPAESDPDYAPVVLWLQGGPGASSLYGLFTENGPFFVDKEGNLTPREYSWSRIFNLIFIDSPVGTGFSFTDDKRGYVRDEVGVGRDLLSALNQFFLLFPNLKKNDFFVTGESYAGKYVPAVAYTIHTSNEDNQSKINLKGIAIGNGLTDPENMMLYGEYLFQIGLIDSDAKTAFNKKQDEILESIQQKNYYEAYEEFHHLIAGDTDSFFHSLTGFSYHYNFMYDKDYSPYGDFGEYVQKNSTRTVIHVGNRQFQDGDVVLQNLKGDFMQTVRPWVEELLEHYRVLFYNGQLDIICAYPLMVNFLRKFEWSGAELYRSAQRQRWTVDNELAGYSKSAKGLTEVLVRNAGHMAPTDQPKWLFDLITRFVFNQPF